MKKLILPILFVAALIISTIYVNSEKEKVEKLKEVKENGEQSVQKILNAKAEEFSKTAPQDLKDDFAKGIKEVEENKVMLTALKKGDKAPNVKLGETNLYEQLENGPIIITWYRGGWCPYCNLYLKSFIDRLSEIRSLGGDFIAVSPEKASEVEKTIYNNKLNFIAVSDIENIAGKQFGIVYTLPELVSKRFEGRINIKEINNSVIEELPLAATYVIGQDRFIEYAFIDSDYRKRAEPAVVIRVLKDLVSKQTLDE